MKVISLILLVFINISAYGETCKMNDEKAAQARMLSDESIKLNIAADYLKSRIEEYEGAYRGNHTLTRLLIETRAKSLDLQRQASAINMQAGQELLDCLGLAQNI